MKRYEIFIEDLKKIKDRKIRLFTEEALEAVDSRFFTDPCSSSGKHHPPEDNGVGGIVRHVKKGLVVVEHFARRALFSETELDISYSAYTLHDSCKNGVVWGDKTDYTHGYLAYEWLQQFKLTDKFVKDSILNAARYHMAPWVYRHTPWEHESFTKQQMGENIKELQRALTNPSRTELAVREADYWSTREGMSYLPGVNAVGPHDKPPEELAENYCLYLVDGILCKAHRVKRKDII